MRGTINELFLVEKTRLRRVIEDMNASGQYAGQWEPIESAPQDGSYFLAWADRDGLMVMVYHGINSSETWSLTGSARNPEPTHWMPLPNPPKTEKE